MVEKISFQYPNLSAGYVGQAASAMTLNARFYQMFFDELPNLTCDINLPQRIPKTGFFEELVSLESPGFSLCLKQKREDILKEAHAALAAGSIDAFFISLRLMLRYGMFSKILSFSLPDDLTPSEVLEFQLIQNSAALDLHLSTGSSYLPGDLQTFAEAVLSLDLSDRLFVMAATHVTVTAYRYKLKVDESDLMVHIAKMLSQRLEGLVNAGAISFDRSLLVSVAYRGLAMNSDFLSQDEQGAMLNQAERLILEAVPKEGLETLLHKENYYTLSQTMSKWCFYQGDRERAERYLQNMLKLDPFDSTGFCEMGVLLMKQDRYHEAEPYFEKAVLLGPPAVGMNLFFYAKCLYEQEKISEAIEQMLKVMKMDPKAVSPYLFLLDHYKKNNNLHARRELCEQLFASEVLRRQLTTDEFDEVRAVLGVV